MTVVERAPANPQEWLDELVRRSRAGLFPAYDLATRSCRYRTDDGRACGVGVLVEDDRYDPDMDNVGCVDDAGFERFLDRLPSWVTAGQMGEVQGVHDSMAHAHYRQHSRAFWDHDRFVAKLLQCSIFRGLTPSEVA